MYTLHCLSFQMNLSFHSLWKHWTCGCSDSVFFLFFFLPTCNEQSEVSVTCWETRHHLYPGQTSHAGFCCQKHHPFNGDKSGRGQSAYCTAELWVAEQRAFIPNDYLLAENLDTFLIHVRPLKMVLCAACFCLFYGLLVALCISITVF